MVAPAIPSDEQIITRAQDVSGTLTPQEVKSRTADFLGFMTHRGGLNLTPISNAQKFERPRLLAYWRLFEKFIPHGTLKKVVLSPSPAPYAFRGGVIKTSWGFEFHLRQGKKLPLVIHQAFNEAGFKIGYNPFFSGFNENNPFAEEWANEHIRPTGL